MAESEGIKDIVNQAANQAATANESWPMTQKLDLVKIKYLHFDSIKSVIFAKLESSTSQKGACITCKADSGADGNQMPLKIFDIFPKTIDEMHAQNKVVVLKTYNNLKTEQLGVCTVKWWHKDKVFWYRFFTVPGDSQSLLGVPDIDLLGILKIHVIWQKVNKQTGNVTPRQ